MVRQCSVVVDCYRLPRHSGIRGAGAANIHAVPSVHKYRIYDVVLAWIDSQGAENGDKCAWDQGPGPQSAAQDVTLGGQSFAVQSLWSNLANGDTGGCVISS